jgi:hypothetical protein
MLQDGKDGKGGKDGKVVIRKTPRPISVSGF